MTKSRTLLIGAAALAMATIACWFAYQRTDHYQARVSFREASRLVRSHPAMPPDTIADWFAAAAIYDRDKAMRELSALPSGSARDEAVARMARGLLAAGRIREALAMAGEIKDASTLASLLGSLAQALTGAGLEVPEVSRELEPALEAERQRKDLSTTALSTISRGLDALGLEDAAAQVNLKVDDAFQRSLAFLALAKSATEEGKSGKSQQFRRDAMAAAKLVAEPSRRFLALMACARDFYLAGEVTLAREAFAASRKEVDSVPDVAARVRWMCILSRLYAASDSPREGVALLDQARALAESIQPAEASSSPRSAISRTFAEYGRLREAREMAATCARPDSQLAAYTSIVREYGRRANK